MGLNKEGLWGIISGVETAPEGIDEHAKFALKRDKVLAAIVLAVDPSLLYLLGVDPNNPAVVWKALADQFQRNTWANKLELKRKNWTNFSYPLLKIPKNEAFHLSKWHSGEDVRLLPWR